MSIAHTHAVILSIGDELVLGQSLDTNSAWLSEQLVSRGIRPIRHVTVDDETQAIASQIKQGVSDAELVIVTGGLGPTSDDLTRVAVAWAMGQELVVDEEALMVLEAWFAEHGMEMVEENRVQALRPEGAVCLDNPHGTAPGLHSVIDESGTDLFCLPGPPREMRAMFERYVLPMLRPARVIETRLLRTFGMGESKVAAAMGDLMERERNPRVGTTASAGVVTVRLRWEGEAEESRASGRKALEETERLVREALGDAVFTPLRSDGTQDLAEVVVGLLQDRGEQLAVVESCTGGLLSSMLTAIPGSSAVFCGGWITYSNAMKIGAVGVPESFFPEVSPRAPGAVSSEVAQAMALGGVQRGLWGSEDTSGLEHAVAITGIAGPGGGTDAKPVGTVWICLAGGDGRMDCRRFLFPGSHAGGRSAVQMWAAVTALGMLRLRLTGVEMELAFEQERRSVE